MVRRDKKTIDSLPPKSTSDVNTTPLSVVSNESNQTKSIGILKTAHLDDETGQISEESILTTTKQEIENPVAKSLAEWTDVRNDEKPDTEEIIDVS